MGLCTRVYLYCYYDDSYIMKHCLIHFIICYLGPALFAYNDASFTSEDWQGIQATGRSIKRKDPNKVGRFGIGFNSVYHITGTTKLRAKLAPQLLQRQQCFPCILHYILFLYKPFHFILRCAMDPKLRPSCRARSP